MSPRRTHTHIYTQENTLPPPRRTHPLTYTPMRMHVPQDNTHTHIHTQETAHPPGEHTFTYTPGRLHTGPHVRTWLPSAAWAFPQFLAWSWWSLSPAEPPSLLLNSGKLY